MLQRSFIANAIPLGLAYWFFTSPRFARFRRTDVEPRVLGTLGREGGELTVEGLAPGATARRSAEQLAQLTEWIGAEEHFWELHWNDGASWLVVDAKALVERVRSARAVANLPMVPSQRLGLVLRAEPRPATTSDRPS